MATLFRRNGIWQINYSVGSKQHRKSTKTAVRRLAEIALKDLELRIFKGELKERKTPERTQIRDVLRRYKLHVEGNCVPDYANHVKYHLKIWQDFFDDHGIQYLQDISEKAVDDFFVTALKDRAAKTKKEYLTSLKACLNRAVRWGVLEKSPVKDVQPPHRIVRNIRFFSKEEVKHLIANASFDLKVAISLLVNTGMRLGELWALRWKDLDLPNSQLWVRSYDGFTPKGRRDRNIPLNAACLEVIHELSSLRNENEIFVYRLTKSYKRLSNKFIRYSKKLGMKGRLHDLRHTFASHLIMSGSPMPVVQELLGHASITTTMVYSHLTPSLHGREVGKLSFLAQKQLTTCNGLQCSALERFKSSHPDFFGKLLLSHRDLPPPRSDF